METRPPNPDSEEEMLAKVRDLDQALPEADKNIGKNKVLQMGIVAVGLVALIALFFWLFASPTPAKAPDKVAAANRGLNQAEGMRTEKELFGKAEQPVLSQAPKPGSRGLSHPGFPEADEAPTGDLADVEPSPVSQPAPSIAVRKSKDGFSSRSEGKGGHQEAADYHLSRELEMRLSENYQKAVAFYGSEQVVFTRSAQTGGGSGPYPLGGVDSALQNLTDRARFAGGHKIVVSAGEELTAVLNETLNTDYPSIVKATLTSPPELSGAIALLSYSLGNERATAQVGKIVLPAQATTMKAKEIALASVVKSGLPGLGGDVNHHWGPQIASGLANAGLTAGALAYAANQGGSDNLGTAVLLAPVIQQGVEGVLKPINYLGRDRPITVTVPAGTEFTILVTEGFEVTP